MRESRLQFTDAERNDPEIGKKVRRAEKAAAKVDKAQVQIPTHKRPKLMADNSNGKIKVRLNFEETRKKPPSELKITEAPTKLVRGQIHRQLQESKEDNVGVEAADTLSSAAEHTGDALQDIHHHAELQPYRAADRAERQLRSANLHALQAKAEAQNPTSNPVSRWRQKQQIKRQYMASKAGRSAAGYTTTGAAKATSKAASDGKKTGEFVVRHRKGFLVIIAIALVAAFLLNVVSSCSMMVEGLGAGLASSSYASQDDAMLGAEETYSQMEAALQQKLDRFQQDYDYDEYHFDLDEIGHDPYVLISILSAMYPEGWTLAQIMPTLNTLFEKQYILTVDVETEIRYRDDGNGGTERYPYTICNVTLENFDLSHVPVYVMNEKTLSRYALYMATLGNRPDLFPDSESVDRLKNGYEDYDIPSETLSDTRFAAMIAEAEKYLGYPYVWGGSSPSTSFDCSGFVCWVVNHSGWSLGRTSAQGLFNACTPISRSNARPGDLIFFQGTYDTPGVSHVGIYVGNNRMIHCGNPISYTIINTQYWQSHFYAFGRLPR
jgi:hypothetical protein